MKERYRIPLNLQLFAEGDPDPEVIEEEPAPTPTYSQSDIDALTSKIDALTSDMKRQALKSAGLKDDDIDAALEFVTGNTPEEIAASIASLSDELPVLIRVAQLRKPTGVDPNPGNGRKQEPKLQDASVKVKQRLDRLVKLGKIRF